MDDEPAELGSERPGEATDAAPELALIGDPGAASELDQAELELEDAPPGSIEVTATIHLQDLGPSSPPVIVDPSAPYIAACLKAGYLVPTGAELADPPDVK